MDGNLHTRINGFPQNVFFIVSIKQIYLIRTMTMQFNIEKYCDG